MNVIDALLGEHGVFYAQIDQLEPMIEGCDSLERLKGLASVFASGFAAHAELEEALVFEPLRARVGAGGDICREHEVISELASRIELGKSPTGVGAMFMRALQAVKRHLKDEEGALFPGVRQALDEGELTDLGGRWAAARQVSV